MDEDTPPKPPRKRKPRAAATEPNAPSDAATPAKPTRRRSAPKKEAIATADVTPRPRRAPAKKSDLKGDKPGPPRRSRKVAVAPGEDVSSARDSHAAVTDAAIPTPHTPSQVALPIPQTPETSPAAAHLEQAPATIAETAPVAMPASSTGTVSTRPGPVEGHDTGFDSLKPNGLESDRTNKPAVEKLAPAAMSAPAPIPLPIIAKPELPRPAAAPAAPSEPLAKPPNVPPAPLPARGAAPTPAAPTSVRPSPPAAAPTRTPAARPPAMAPTPRPASGAATATPMQTAATPPPLPTATKAPKPAQPPLQPAFASAMPAPAPTLARPVPAVGNATSAPLPRPAVAALPRETPTTASTNATPAATRSPQLPAPSKRPAAAPAAPMVPSFARKPAPAPVAAATPRPADTSTRSLSVIDWLLGYLPQKYRGRIREYLVLMRMDRPVGALLLLWPTWWALWFAANDFPPLSALLIFTVGVFVMRSAGCVINDYADHGWLDANVERTRGRPMAAGRVSKKEALLLFAGLLASAFVLVLFTNALTIKLAFVGAALAAIYPFTKRVTHLAQVVLGAAFGWSIPMAFAAVTNSLPPLCWLLFLGNVLFSTIYDTEYAMVDRDDDTRVGAKSTAILFGEADRVAIGVLMVTFVFAMLLAGTRATLHWPYFVGVAVATGLLVYQQWLIRDRAREHCFTAFRNNNWVGLALWVGLVLALAIR